MNNSGLMKVLFFSALSAVTVLSLIPIKSTFDFNNQDKINHLIAYSALTFLGILSFGLSRSLKKAAVFMLILTAYGITIEWIQQYTGREMSFADVMANTLGIVSGAAIHRGLTAITKSRKPEDIG